ncbi:MAG TPA: diacylglycerol kinase family protein [Clostridia bacterium]|nr:diacylglycerol kinase family protein [Clostridia bacterium]
MEKNDYHFQIIANFLAGTGEAKKLLSDLKEFLDSHHQSYRVLKVTQPTPISQLPLDGRIKITKGVICLGGDGTVSETVGYVLNHQIKAPIAIIPVGTANIIAATLGLKKEKAGFDFLLKNKLIEVDVGVTQYQDKKHFFLLGMGLGFEEKFLKLTKEKLKKKMGVFSYILAALSELLSLSKIPLVLEFKGQKHSVDVCLLTILNLKPKILSFFPLFAHQEIEATDGQFNLYLVEYRNYFQALAGTLLFHLLGQKNFGLVKSFSAQEFVLRSKKTCGTQVDGELRSCLPVKVFFHPQACRFLIP